MANRMITVVDKIVDGVAHTITREATDQEEANFRAKELSSMKNRFVESVRATMQSRTLRIFPDWGDEKTMCLINSIKNLIDTTKLTPEQKLCCQTYRFAIKQIRDMEALLEYDQVKILFDQLNSLTWPQ